MALFRRSAAIAPVDALPICSHITFGGRAAHQRETSKIIILADIRETIGASAIPELPDQTRTYIFIEQQMHAAEWLT